VEPPKPFVDGVDAFASWLNEPPVDHEPSAPKGGWLSEPVRWSTVAGWEEPVSEPKPKEKPFVISKSVVWEAYLRVKANRPTREPLVSTGSRSRSSSGT